MTIRIKEKEIRNKWKDRYFWVEKWRRFGSKNRDDKDRIKMEIRKEWNEVKDKKLNSRIEENVIALKR